MEKNRLKFVLLLMLIPFFLSCESIVKDIIFTNSLNVSKGDHGDYISLSWSADSEKDADDETIYATSYTITRYTDNGSGPLFDQVFYTPDTYYADDDIIIGEIYHYDVESNLSPGLTTNREWGYALNPDPLKIYGNEGRYSHLLTTSVSSVNRVWFDFEAQEGWTYHFKPVPYSGPGGDPGLDVSITLFKKHIRNSDMKAYNSGTGFDELIWTCTSSDTYFLRVSESTGANFLLDCWHSDP